MEIREFSSYQEMNEAHQKEIDEFPMIWLFASATEEEIQDALSKIGAKSLKECVGNGCGGIILKADKERYIEMFKRHDKEREAFKQSEQGLYQMILSEMINHEYGYSQDPDDTLSALGKTEQDLETDSVFRKAWKQAEKRVLRSA